MSALGYATDIESAARIVSQSAPEKRLDAFRLVCRENIRWTDFGVAKPDVVDHLRDIGIMADLREDDIQTVLAEAVLKPFNPSALGAPPALTPLQGITAAALATKPVPVRQWYVADLIPASVPTILAGDGDAGKTLLGLQLAAAGAARKQWIGRDVAGGKTIYFSAEDDRDELHRRLADIAKAMGVDLADLDKLMIVPLVEEPDTILAAPDGRGDVLKPTPLWNRVEALVADWRPALAVFDPRADLFGGNEISRPQARQFIGMLRRLGVKYETTALLLDHPSLTGMSSGSGQSGSTGWRNSVRSMLYLQRVTAKGDKLEVEPDTDRRTLTNKKANYSRRGVDIALRWQNGAFVLDDGSAAEIAAAPQNALADLVFLELVNRYSIERRYVSATPSPNYAPAIFAKDAAANGIGKSALVGSMNRLFNAGQLRVEDYGPPSRRLKRLVVVPEAA